MMGKRLLAGMCILGSFLLCTSFGFAALTDGLVDYYPLYTNLSSATNPANTGSIWNAVSQVSFARPGASGSYNFSGATSNIGFSSTHAGDNLNLTVCSWAYIASGTSPSYHAAWGLSSACVDGQNFYDAQGLPGSDTIGVWEFGSFAQAVPVTNHEFDSWYMTCYVYDDSTNNWLMYVNDTNIGNVTNTLATPTVPGSTLKLYAGDANACGLATNLYVSDLVLWNRTLSTPEIAGLYSCEASGGLYDSCINSVDTPTINEVTLGVSGDNRTFTLAANATGNSSENLDYYYKLFYNSTLFANGTLLNQASGLNVTLVMFNQTGAGTYSANVIASNGTVNSTSLNSNTITITLPLNQPVVREVNLEVSVDNQTFTLSANATDADDLNISYSCMVFRNNVNFQNCSLLNQQNGLNETIFVFNQTGTGGYNATVIASVGALNSQPMASNTVNLTFPKDSQLVDMGGFATSIMYQGQNYTVRTFTYNDTFTAIDARNLSVLVIGGGGGGGSDNGGGGGAGGFIYNDTMVVPAGSYAVVVGQGGAPGLLSTDSNGANGQDTTFLMFTANGGGGGGGFNASGGRVGKDGASGGGASLTNSIDLQGGAATPAGQGNTGGGTFAADFIAPYAGAGGGGAGAPGQNATSGVPGNGGDGLSSNITGIVTYYAGGGGGGANSAGGLGGNGGGGNGTNNNAGGSAGVDGTGSGGGGGGVTNQNTGNKGGNGVVIIRYLTSPFLGEDLYADGLSVNTTTRDFKATFTATLHSQHANLTNFTFSYDNGSGTLVNDSTVTGLTDGVFLANVNKVLPSLVGTTIRYQWFFSNTSYTNHTDIKSFQVTVTQNGTDNYTKYPFNPVGDTMISSTYIEGNTVHQWYTFNVNNDANGRIMYVNTTNISVITDMIPFDVSHRINVSGIPIGFNFPDVVQVNNSYVLFAVNSSDAKLYRFDQNGTSKIDFHEVCGGPVASIVNGSFAAMNKASFDYDAQRNIWDGYIEGRYTSDFMLTRFNSTDGCNFVQQENLGFQDGTPWVRHFNGTWVIYFANYTYQDTWRINRASGPSLAPDDLRAHSQDIFANVTGWALNPPGHFIDYYPDIVIVPNNSQQYFDKKFYLFYTSGDAGDQMGYAFDADNRSFYEVENITAPVAPPPVSLTQVTLGVTSNNQTFVLAANGVSSGMSNVTYFYAFFVNNTILLSGNTSYFPSGMNATLLQFNETAAGTYNATVIASDGTENSTQMGSNSITVTPTFNNAPVNVWDTHVYVADWNYTNTRFWGPYCTDADNNQLKITVNNSLVSFVYNPGQYDDGRMQSNFTGPGDVGNYSLLISCSDGLNTTSKVALLQVTAPIVPAGSLSMNGSCPLSYPNEDDLPGVAVVNATFVVDTADAITSATQGGSLPMTGCTNTSLGPFTTFTCGYTVHYYQAAGAYQAYLNVTTASNSTSNLTVCNVGELMASKRLTNVVNFPTAVPGVVNASGDNPVVVRNTGNVVLNLSMKGFDLVGTTTNATLSAGDFVAGAVLGSSVAMQNNVQKDLNMQTVVGHGSNSSVNLWLSMPSNAVVDAYTTPVFWQLITTHG